MAIKYKRKFFILQELDSPVHILNMSIIDNVSSITLLPIESLFREMSKAPICEIKANEKKLIVEKSLCITYEQLLSTLIIVIWSERKSIFFKVSSYIDMKEIDVVFPLRSTKHSFIDLKITCREYRLIKNNRNQKLTSIMENLRWQLVFMKTFLPSLVFHSAF